jgi:hypothetical protein
MCDRTNASNLLRGAVTGRAADKRGPVPAHSVFRVVAAGDTYASTIGY